MIVYIQKKINNKWRTILTISSTIAQQTLDYLRKHGCQCKFRISKEKTDDVPITPQGDLTWEQSTETFVKIADIIFQMHRRYKY
jgi:hypothetical protein